jgi:hypothetical protein
MIIDAASSATSSLGGPRLSRQSRGPRLAGNLARLLHGSPGIFRGTLAAASVAEKARGFVTAPVGGAAV